MYMSFMYTKHLLFYLSKSLLESISCSYAVQQIHSQCKDQMCGSKLITVPWWYLACTIPVCNKRATPMVVMATNVSSPKCPRTSAALTCDGSLFFMYIITFISFENINMAIRTHTVIVSVSAKYGKLF